LGKEVRNVQTVSEHGEDCGGPGQAWEKFLDLGGSELVQIEIGRGERPVTSDRPRLGIDKTVGLQNVPDFPLRGGTESGQPVGTVRLAETAVHPIHHRCLENQTPVGSEYLFGQSATRQQILWCDEEE
jgi:hypothetical protein